MRNISINQRRTLLRLLQQLRPHWRRDPALPARIQALFAAHREFGARDRRLYRELIYTALRFLPWIEPLLDPNPDEAVRRVAWLAADTPATRAFREDFAIGEMPSGNRAELLPGWFHAHCPEVFAEPELEAQLQRAAVWVRLQTDAAGELQVRSEFEERGWDWRPSPVLSGALALPAGSDVTQTRAWTAGRIEVQDLGSQLILASIGVERGGDWLDACAGAGGKALQLARLVGPHGNVDAHDIRPAALDEMVRRADRGGITNIRLAPDPRGAYEGVLVDAPCSGSGTWRRSPHLKWTTTEGQIARAAEIQARLLRQFSGLVKPGGRLIYATCSLSRRENEDVVDAFLAQDRDFAPAPFAETFGAASRGAGLLILPARHNTDGFFVASLRRR